MFYAFGGGKPTPPVGKNILNTSNVQMLNTSNQDILGT